MTQICVIVIRIQVQILFKHVGLCRKQSEIQFSS